MSKNASPVPTMKITGWFQVAWSAEIEPRQIKPMKYFDTNLVAWRTNRGDLYVMDAHCEHLGAHLGYGGRVTDDDNIACPFHGWEWTPEGKNAKIPYQDRPNKARRIRSWPVRELNECVFVWHDALDREPFFEPQDIFTEMYDDGATSDDYYRAYPEGVVIHENVQVHPQWVMENGVDFAHFQYVHRSGSLPRLTSQNFMQWEFDTTFEMTFGEGKEPTPLTPDGATTGGVHSHSIGLGIGAALFSGPDTMRTWVCVTPVDDKVCTLRSTVWLPKRDAADGEQVPADLEPRMGMANRQVERDLNIWAHQIYLDPPALATMEAQGYRTIREWTKRFYPLDYPEQAEAATAQTNGKSFDLVSDAPEPASAQV
jgi:3-ketosteroid 9alpha-monooxygenase subunit A